VRIIMQAFGPFAQRQALDFTCLRRDALFLIHGSTGSGKTTVLDAMCYALYGESSGDERDGADMRSHHAEADCPTEVMFDFSLGSDLYRVHRMPRQVRPKVRGEGTTTHNPEAHLYRIDSAGDEIEVLATGERNVTQHVERLLGFKAHEFRQVIVLPQGRFRELLSGGSDQRQKILEALFQTSYYRRVERALKDEASNLKKHAEELKVRLDTRTPHLIRLLAMPEDVARTSEAIEDAWRAFGARLQEAKDAEKRARQEEKAARKRFEAANEAQRLLEELGSAKAAVATLDAEAAAIKARRAALKTARRAAPLEASAQAVEDAGDVLRRAETHLGDASKDLKRASKDAEEAKQTLLAETGKAAQQARALAAREVARLEAMRDGVHDLASARAETNVAVTVAAQAEERKAAREKTAKEAQTALTAASEQHKQTREAAALLPAANAAFELAETRCRRHAKLQAARNEVRRLHDVHEEATAADREAQKGLDQAARTLKKARRERHEARAAQLAGTLEDGAPCPVCGSLDHPDPASADGATPDDDAVEALEAEEAILAKARAAAAEALAGTHIALEKASTLADGLTRELGEAADQEPAALARALKTAKEALASTRSAAEALPTHERAERTTRTKTEAAEKKEAEARNAAEEADTKRQLAAAALESLSKRIPEALQTPEGWKRALRASEKRVGELQRSLEKARNRSEEAALQEATAAEAHKGAEGAVKKARKACEGRTRTFRDTLQEAGFESPAAWHAARMETAAMEAEADAIAAYDKAHAAAEGLWKRAQAAAADVEAPDLPMAVTVLETCEKNTRDAASVTGGLERDQTEIVRLRAEISKDAGELADLETEYGIVGHLAKIADGGNARRLSFQRFVLASRLEEVLDVASVQLANMTQGRYRLRRRQESGDQRRAGGLEIDVDDNETGTARPIRTLSGGEGFLAALAFSLATADVVQRHAGGLRLDAIFVDEGFGSLDDEALDRALRTLTSLHEGGRLVGIVSHVPELRERIDVRLEVRKTDRGSVAAFVLP